MDDEVEQRTSNPRTLFGACKFTCFGEHEVAVTGKRLSHGCVRGEHFVCHLFDVAVVAHSEHKAAAFHENAAASAAELSGESLQEFFAESQLVAFVKSAVKNERELCGLFAFLGECA